MCDENDSDLEIPQDSNEDIQLSSENLITLNTGLVSLSPSVDDAVTMDCVGGLNFVESVKAATSSNILLNSPLLEIDGYNLQSEDRVLLLGQYNPQENGIYIWNATTNLLERSYEFRENSIIEEGVFTFVERGFSYSDVGFVSSNRATIGRDPINFLQFSNSTNTTFQKEDAYMFLNSSPQLRDKWVEIKELYESVLNDSGFEVSEVEIYNYSDNNINETDAIFKIKCNSFYLHFTIESFVLNSSRSVLDYGPKYTYNYSRGSVNTKHYSKLLDKLKSPKVYESIINWLSLLDV